MSITSIINVITNELENQSDLDKNTVNTIISNIEEVGIKYSSEHQRLALLLLCKHCLENQIKVEERITLLR